MKDELEKLKRKAEICRYAHSRLAESACRRRRCSEVLIATLTLALSVMVVLFYREIFAGLEAYLVFGIGVLPALILFIQTLSNVFGWAKKETDHKLAAHVWGMWIRDASFNAPLVADAPAAQEKIAELRKKYLECMEQTPLIPNEKFLSYKIAFRRRKILAKKIDGVEGEDGELLSALDKLERECAIAEQKNIAAERGKTS